ncbi:hypothetical protein CG717_16325 [Streptomyces sp. CB02613]|uniref:hypothetical protein n=1 Tax=Streptomyces sp. CB02613 TaxID=2020328 RepID=UPI000CB12AB9|nr:hypothetical protein [Streptomyces sp. CB02613]PJN31331.1 hypothetical protein CG717_16325 [Streptomyces sp. CB02613]
MTTALDRARARLDTPPTTPIPGQLDLKENPMENTTNPCTCDDENTLVTVDMGPEDGGTVDMCVGCYDAMRDEGGH